MARDPEIIIVDPDIGARSDLKHMLMAGKLAVVGEADYGIEAVTAAKEHAPDIFLISMEEPVARALQTMRCWAPPRLAPRSSSTQPRRRRVRAPGDGRRRARLPGQAAEAGRAGPRHLQHPGAGRAPPPPDGRRATEPVARGTVVTVFGAKGGIGKTTIATNLATALVQAHASATSPSSTWTRASATSRS